MLVRQQWAKAICKDPGQRILFSRYCRRPEDLLLLGAGKNLERTTIQEAGSGVQETGGGQAWPLLNRTGSSAALPSGSVLSG